MDVCFFLVSKPIFFPLPIFSIQICLDLLIRGKEIEEGHHADTQSEGERDEERKCILFEMIVMRTIDFVQSTAPIRLRFWSFIAQLWISLNDWVFSKLSKNVCYQLAGDD